MLSDHTYLRLPMDEPIRYRYTITGRVQGVGFRPWVYRHATRLGIAGSVRNDRTGVIIELESNKENIQALITLLTTSPPPNAFIESLLVEHLPARGEQVFVIEPSTSDLTSRIMIPVDTALCSACLSELTDSTNRRFHYPFISCATCGPRFSILKKLPFDRAHTALDAFPLCVDCAKEYKNPSDRRFHAQTTSCSVCGPRVWLSDCEGHTIAHGDSAIGTTAAAITAGQVVAVKGVGGFHLLVDAHSDAAVSLLREGKKRGNKPFAILYGTLEEIARDCVIHDEEERLLLDSRAPIVLLRRRAHTPLSELVAPNSPYVGAMLPSSPLHYLLMRHVTHAVVATSGNRRGEPLCYENQGALHQLGEFVPLFLLHNRPIINPSDDSIWQIIEKRPFPRRLGRGYAPYAISAGIEGVGEGVAIGGITKSSVAVGNHDRFVIGPYGGSPSVTAVMQRHESTIALLSPSGACNVTNIISDLHPDGVSPMIIKQPGSQVQHHLAHAWSAVLDGEISLPVCAVVWDGAGYGTDGTLWGGEWLIVSEEGYERRYHLRPFWLLGGDRAALLPERAAAALWVETFGDQARASPVWSRLRESDTLWRMRETSIGCTATTSMGRLFDGIASALGICHVNTFEGEAAIRLEVAARQGSGPGYPITLGPAASIDWAPLIRGVEADITRHVPSCDVAHRFHQSLVQLIGDTAEHIGISRIVLTGGCFQNTLLLEGAIHTLQTRGFSPHWHHRIPCHDEGLSIGQLAAARGMRSQQRERGSLCV